MTIDRRLQTEDRVARVYTPLELAGRDLYVREGCYNCHSQMIRTLVPDVMRYGDYSRLGESIWDHPYQWGSKRTGPDLARIGGKYNHAWQYDHLENPRNISTGSNMPGYTWLLSQDTDYAVLPAKIRAQRLLGVPFPNWSPADVDRLARAQAKDIAKELRDQGRYVEADREVVALIAYLQSLGQTSPQSAAR
jgi:cytochrome c oxidase cbb3-type subunit I/II